MTPREDLQRSGAAIRKQLGFPPIAPETELAPGLNQLSTEMVFASVWARPGLGMEDRMLATLAALTSVQYLPQLRRYVGAALHIGLPARTIQEVIIHCGIYAGFPSILNSLAVANEVFAEQGVEVPDDDMPNPDADALAQLGNQVMTDLHGARSTLGYADPDNPAAEIYRVAVDYGYGDIWNRPGLNRRQRLICALAAFTALQMTSQVVKFSQAALNTDLTKTEITEAISQTAPYAGFPKALNAFAALAEVIDG